MGTKFLSPAARPKLPERQGLCGQDTPELCFTPPGGDGFSSHGPSFHSGGSQHGSDLGLGATAVAVMLPFLTTGPQNPPLEDTGYKPRGGYWLRA